MGICLLWDDAAIFKPLKLRQHCGLLRIRLIGSSSCIITRVTSWIFHYLMIFEQNICKKINLWVWQLRSGNLPFTRWCCTLWTAPMVMRQSQAREPSSNQWWHSFFLARVLVDVIRVKKFFLCFTNITRQTWWLLSVFKWKSRERFGQAIVFQSCF